MAEKDVFFAAPDLDHKGSAPVKKESTLRDRITTERRGPVKEPETHRTAGGLQIPSRDLQTFESSLRMNSGISGRSGVYEMTEDMRRKLSEKLMNKTTVPSVKNVLVDNAKERVIVRFQVPKRKIYCDIEVPLDITANDLIVGLNDAYSLGMDITDIRQCYLNCENPIALLKGKKMLGEYGIRDGSLITYYR